MPALIGLSPRLADHTFPKDELELRTAAVALGKLSELVDNNTVRILGTEFFVTLLRDFNWDEAGSMKNQIFTHLSRWFLNGRAVVVRAEIGTRSYTQHPVPENCRTAQGLEEIWADELGKLVVLHDEHGRNGEYFIGIACEKAFAGDSIGRYENHECSRFFPLVGPERCDCRESTSLLTDAFERQVPSNYTQTGVSFAAAKKNCFVLGASEVRRPRRGSHYKVKFRGDRSWTLDANHDPVLERHLKELEQITGHRLETIIYALREGELPPRRLRLDTSVG